MVFEIFVFFLISKHFKYKKIAFNIKATFNLAEKNGGSIN